jgi:hypothetical protein
MCLPVKETNYLSSLQKGFAGEQKFDSLLENLSENWLIINDLLLEYNNTLFQIDSLLIADDTIKMFDVKNYDGDHYLEGSKWYKGANNEIKDPLLQLTRCESLLRRLLHDLGFNTIIESKLVFVNPDFYLYQAPLNLPAIFPSQLNRFMNKLNMKTGKLKDRHFKLAQKLVSSHLKEVPFSRFSDYNYDQLEKGIACTCWHSFMRVDSKDTLVCNECGLKENVESAVLRNVEEFKMLFPEQKITTNAIHEWCKIITSKKTIRRILAKNFKLIRNGRSSYYDKE